MARGSNAGKLIGIVVAVVAVFLVVLFAAGVPSFCQPPASNPAPTN
jgi:hypothetical protein